MGRKENDPERKAKQKQEEEYVTWNEWWDLTVTWLYYNLNKDVPTIQPFGISVVPDELRKWNENAYKPKVVSMGPTYKGTRRDLLQMEETKWFCMLSLTHRLEGRTGGLVDFSKIVWFGDDYLRRCYTEEISMDRIDLATTMLCDCCFMLELLISGSKELNERIVSPFDKDITAQVRKREDVLTDLMLLENQLPLVAVTDLSQNLFPKEFGESVDDYDTTHDVFRNIALSLLGCSPRVSSTNTNHRRALHFLELVHSCIFLGSDDDEKMKLEENDQGPSVIIHVTNEEQVDGLNRCATRLRVAGVTIKPPQDQRVTTNNKPGTTVSSFNFDIRFNNGTLEIPQLHITESTEALWRNFIAWEHHKKKWKSMTMSAGTQGGGTGTFRCKCTSAALLFNGLICSSSDVQLLKDKKVIVDHLNMSNRDLVDFFHSITKGVDRGIVDSSYSKMVAALNTYSATNKATQIPIIGWHYLSKIPEDLFYSLKIFLRRGYNFAATFILVLTVIQTLYSVLSYHHGK